MSTSVLVVMRVNHVEGVYGVMANHTEDMCDKCGKLVGKANLHKLPFLYLDRNDTQHPDEGDGYRQYYVCLECTGRDKRRML